MSINKTQYLSYGEYRMLELSAQYTDRFFPGTLAMFYALNEPPAPPAKSPTDKPASAIELIRNPNTGVYEERKK